MYVPIIMYVCVNTGIYPLLFNQTHYNVIYAMYVFPLNSKLTEDHNYNIH